jgi:aconitate hydratase
VVGLGATGRATICNLIVETGATTGFFPSDGEFSALHLGVRAAVAKGFARIRRSNLIAYGILSLVFADPADYDRVELGSPWRISGIRQALADGGELESRLGDRFLVLCAELTGRERRILRDRGLLAHARGRLTSRAQS